MFIISQDGTTFIQSDKYTFCIANNYIYAINYTSKFTEDGILMAVYPSEKICKKVMKDLVESTAQFLKTSGKGYYKFPAYDKIKDENKEE